MNTLILGLVLSVRVFSSGWELASTCVAEGKNGMARIHSSGWELGTNGALMDGGTWEGLGVVPTRDASAARSGGFGMLPATTATVSGVSKTIDMNFLGGVQSFVRFYIRVAVDVSALTTICHNQTNTTLPLFFIRLNADRTLELWDSDGATQLGSDSPALSLNVWHRIEIHHISGSVSVYVATEDGPRSLYLSGSYENIAESGGIIQLGKMDANTGTLHFDDFGWNDSLGTEQNSFCGPGHILNLMPNADGDNAMGSRGGTDSGSNWGQIDERTPNDITDYYILDIDNDIIDVGIENLSGLISKNSQVRLIHVGIRHRCSAALLTTYQARIKSQVAGIVQSGTATNHDDTNWLSNGDALPRVYGLTSYTDPQTGGRWTVPLVDSAQIGVIATAATLADAWFTTIWALVEYMPPRVGDPIKAGGTVVPFPR